MDLAELKRLYGDRMVLIGNADANVVQMGTPEAVRAEVRRCLDEGAPGGGYFLSGGVTQATPVRNLLAYFHEARTYQGTVTRVLAAAVPSVARGAGQGDGCASVARRGSRATRDCFAPEP